MDFEICRFFFAETYHTLTKIKKVKKHNIRNLKMSLLPFWALTVSVSLLSMQGQKGLGFHQKYIFLCSEDEQMSYGN